MCVKRSLAWLTYVFALNAAVASLALADEGKVEEPAQSVASERSALYSGRSSADAVSKRAAARTHAKAAAPKSARGSVAKAARSSDFYLYGATSTLRSDRDGDGYHAEFRVRFDADVVIGDASVYARLYLRRAGEGEWFLYHETDDFWISGQTDDDEYYVSTTLDDGYATAEYDVLIDLYETGFSGVVATLGPLDSGALSYLPLEESGLDVPLDIPGYAIRDIFTELIADNDDDGYFSSFRITFDPDADSESRFLYARVWVRPRGGEWIEEYATEDFAVDLVGTADLYSLDVEWRSGYPSSLYDVQIDLYDSASDLLVASAGSDWPALAQIPLEDQQRDVAVSRPTPPSGGDSSSREGGGGLVTQWWIVLLSLLLAAKTMSGRSHAKVRSECANQSDLNHNV